MRPKSNKSQTFLQGLMPCGKIKDEKNIPGCRQQNMGKVRDKLIFAAGGTGGHIFPALAVYQYIKKIKPRIEVLFVISGRTTDEMILKEYKCRYKVLSAKPMPAFFAFGKVIIFIFGFLKSIAESFAIFREYKADMVVGFGSYVSAPVALVAFFKRKDIILHEQNVLPSRTNLFLKRFAGQVLLSFEETKKFFRANNTFVTGNPLRENLMILEKEEASGLLGFKSESFNILVMGGSQGAKVLNEIVPQALNLINKEKKQKISVLHLTGTGACDVRGFYEKMHIEAKTSDFLKEMEIAFSACDLAITRAGALTLSELSFFGLPAVLVPYIHDKGFQLENAKYYTGKEAAFLLEEKDFTPQNLKNLIEEIMDKPQLLMHMKKNMFSLNKTSATGKFFDIILNYD